MLHLTLKSLPKDNTVNIHKIDKNKSNVVVDSSAEVLSKAFYDYAYLGYAKKSLFSLYKPIIRDALKYGEVYSDDGEAGRAVWLRPGKSMIGAIRFFKAIQIKEICDIGLRNIIKMSRQSNELHDYYQRKNINVSDRWYLFCLGVDPLSQGKGIGKQLIRHKLKRLDILGEKAYLETAEKNNIAIYKRYGFRLVDSFWDRTSDSEVFIMFYDREPDNVSNENGDV